MTPSTSASPYLPNSLQNHFLLSMPHMEDTNFDHTLTYICEHSEDGAMGIVINRPMGMILSDLLQHLELDYEGTTEKPIYIGGPVKNDRGFILHTPTEKNWNSSYNITDQLSLTTSVDILREIGKNRAPDQFLIALGYAGWGEGQLEQEMSDNVWLSCPANLDIMFRTPAEERLQAAAATLGININLLTSQTGHA